MSIILWVAFVAFVLFLLWLDLFVFHRESRDLSTKEALGWSAFWIAIGLAFSGVIYVIYEHGLFGATLDASPREVVHDPGLQAVVRYLTGYLLEKSLSVDNLFVMSLIFGAFRVEAQFQHRVLFWGIVGALVMRFLMIGGGIWLVSRFTWMFYVFGALLIVSGLKMLKTAEEPEELSEEWWMRLLRRLVPVREAEGGRFIVRSGGSIGFTPLALALMAVETADLIFAVDSIPAILAVSTEEFIVVTSNVFAILGLRSLYFVLAKMITKFHFLEVALSILLVLIGLKMVVHSFLPIPNLVSLALVVLIVGGGVALSLWKGDKTP